MSVTGLDVIARGSSQPITDIYYVPPPNDVPNIATRFFSEFYKARSPWAREVFRLRLAQLDPAAGDALIGRALDSLDRSVDAQRKAWADVLKSQTETQKSDTRIKVALIQSQARTDSSLISAEATLGAAAIRAEASIISAARLSAPGRAAFAAQRQGLIEALAAEPSAQRDAQIVRRTRQLAAELQRQGVTQLQVSAALQTLEQDMAASGLTDTEISDLTQEFRRIAPGGPVDPGTLVFPPRGVAPRTRFLTGAGAEELRTEELAPEVLGTTTRTRIAGPVAPTAEPAVEGVPAPAAPPKEPAPPSQPPGVTAQDFTQVLVARLLADRERRAAALGQIGDPLVRRDPAARAAFRGLREQRELPSGELTAEQVSLGVSAEEAISGLARRRRRDPGIEGLGRGERGEPRRTVRRLRRRIREAERERVGPPAPGPEELVRPPVGAVEIGEPEIEGELLRLPGEEEEDVELTDEDLAALDARLADITAGVDEDLLLTPRQRRRRARRQGR